MKTSITTIVRNEINLIHGGVSRDGLSVFIMMFSIGLGIGHVKGTPGIPTSVVKIIEVFEVCTVPVVMAMSILPIVVHLLGQGGGVGHRAW